MKLGLSRTITLALIVAAIVPATVVAGIGYFSQRATVVDASNNELRSYAIGLMDVIDRNLFERDGDVQAFARNPIAATGDAKAVTALANDLTRLYGIYDLMLVADARTGLVVAANTIAFDGKPVDTSVLLGRDVQAETWFKACRAPREGTFSESVRRSKLVEDAAAGDGWSAQFAYPIKDPASGEVVRVWVNFASNSRIVGSAAGSLSTALHDAGFGEAEMLVLNDQGIVLAGTNGYTVGRDLSSDVDVQEVRAFTKPTGFDDDTHSHGFSPSMGALGFKGLGISVLLREELGIVVGKMDKLLHTLQLTLGLTAAFALFAGWNLGRRLSRPVSHASQQLVETANQIGSASSQVSGSSQTLAQGASQQASSLEETSAALEELAAGTRQNADHARQADALAKEAQIASSSGEQESRRVAAEVTRQMAALADAVKAIRSATERTAAVVETIDEIAFQTNLLALNAAVEAARAGEAGAGFAVVADEVRALAQRSAEEVKSTNALMLESKSATERVQAASAEIDAYLRKAVGEDVLKAFQAVVAASGRVTQLMAEVAAASDEQAKGIGQVNAAVADIDKVTQANAAAAEESAAASEELTAQAAELRQMVSRLEVVVHGTTRPVDAEAEPAEPLIRPVARTTQHLAPVRQTNRTSQNLGVRRTQAEAEAILPLGDTKGADHQGDYSKF